MMDILLNEMYFRYEMSDGHFDGDALPDISKPFSKKSSSPKEKIKSQVAAVNGGKMLGRALVLDENLSPTIVDKLQTLGYKVKSFEKGTLDADIITYADKANAIVVTSNLRDFNKWGITTFKVSENMKSTKEVNTVVEAINRVEAKAQANPGVIAPGKNVSLAEHKQ